MNRASHITSIAIVIGAVLAGTSAPIVAQLRGSTPSPTSPSTTPGLTTPGVTTPGTTTPGLTDTLQTMPTGRSTWRAQDGSVVDLSVDPATGALTGTFAPGFPCGETSAGSTSPASRPIVGTVNGNAVAWTLGLPACPSVGTWIGHYRTVETEEQLAVLWTLAVADFPPGVGSTLTGSAIFVRQAAQ
jgi:hypothetical protein